MCSGMVQNMDWVDQGLVLSVRRHGESSVVASLLTASHGRHAGLVRGGQSRRLRGVLQPGNLVSAAWRARLEEHLGAFSLELEKSLAAPLLPFADRLAALGSLCALIDNGLPEREAHPALFDITAAVMVALDCGDDAWAPFYVQWELDFLRELGFGLDLSQCAATGVVEDLCFVSPKSGRAVSASAAEPYRDRLLPLPGFLMGDGPVDSKALVDGLSLTGYFLEKHVFAVHGQTLPVARERLIEIMRRRSLEL
jgi:DNA repair protein RecO (recombination protein O)